MSEQDLLVWFHNREAVALGVITDGRILPNTNEGDNVGNGDIIKPYHTVSF